MYLPELGLNGTTAYGDGVAILVGPNGAGKSNFLRELAIKYREHRDVTIICNTVHDRFSRIQGIRKLTAGNSSSSPKEVIKGAIRGALTSDDSSFYQISSILEYCRYAPRIGVLIEPDHRKASLRPLDTSFPDERGLIRSDPEYHETLEFLNRFPREGIVWVDQTQSALKFSQSRQFASALRFERELRRDRAIRPIRLFLERWDGAQIELRQASSGELTLLSSVIFLITQTGSEALVFIDEPENSLHPRWQREYVDVVLAALQYRNIALVIATHSPLIVTGALTQNPSIVTVHQIQHYTANRLDLESAEAHSNGIEEVLWKAFDVVTPANHYVTEEIAEALTDFEAGKRSKTDVLTLIEDMSKASFEDKQRDFFGAVRDLVNQVQNGDMASDA